MKAISFVMHGPAPHAGPRIALPAALGLLAVLAPIPSQAQSRPATLAPIVVSSE